jgi:hypothetical protein
MMSIFDLSSGFSYVKTGHKTAAWTSNDVTHVTKEFAEEPLIERSHELTLIAC